MLRSTPEIRYFGQYERDTDRRYRRTWLHPNPAPRYL
jgi:hypothetical protein